MSDDAKKFSIIDKDMTVEGTLSGKGRLVVKGVVKGTISGETVIISEKGRVSADATVQMMTIGGSFDGKVEAAKELVILATGKCSGEVICNDLVVEAGAQLNASVSCSRTSKKK